MDEFTFTDSPFVSANEKHRVIKAWARFLKGGCRFSQFTQALYHHLTMRCSFSAHYNRPGFYDHYFSTPQRKRRFFSQFDEAQGCRSVELGVDWWLTGECDDLNRAMVRVAAGYLCCIYAQCDDEERQRDLELASALLSKHGVDTGQAVPVVDAVSATAGTQLSLL